MQDSKRDTDVSDSLLDSVGEGEGGLIWENGIETYITSNMTRITSPGLMHDTGCLGRGYAFISVNNSRIWVPLRLVKLQNERPNHAPVSGTVNAEDFHLCDKRGRSTDMGTVEEADSRS